ncbi:MAG TPA: MFS transporter [Myxococcota bacterium]|nr:MFS transporter [Myxococcota bacterium]
MRVERAPATTPRAWTWYVLAMGAWFLAIGLNQVLVPALVTQELRANAGGLATVQTASQIPTILLILLGGAVADRADRRRLLVGLYLAAAALTAGLALCVQGGLLSLPVMIAYGALLAALSAFLMPARDSLLSDVAEGDLMRAVSLLAATQWSMQAVGSFAARLGERAGVPALIGAQSLVIALGAFAVWRLPRHAQRESSGRALSLHELAEGVAEVVRSPELRVVALLAITLGILFIGPFMVVFPILIRDFYHGDLGDLALLFGSFQVGIIVSSGILIARGGVERKGRAQLLALGGGGVCMCLVGLGLPFVAVLAVWFSFGLGAAVFMNASRTLFQERAPQAHRGRVLSVYTLATMGASGIVGAPLSGVLVTRVGPLPTCTLAGVAMCAVVAAFWLASDVRRLE